MTLEEFGNLYDQLMSSRSQGHYTSLHSGEEIDSAVEKVLVGPIEVKIKSSTPGSDKIFSVSVDDSGSITAKEII